MWNLVRLAVFPRPMGYVLGFWRRDRQGANGG